MKPNAVLPFLESIVARGIGIAAAILHELHALKRENSSAEMKGRVGERGELLGGAGRRRFEGTER